MPRRLLVVATASVPAADLRASVRSHAGEDAELLVIAPASGISRLDWLTNAEDDARTDAAERADELAEAAPTHDVDSRVGDSDPVKAIEDALRTFRPMNSSSSHSQTRRPPGLKKEARKPPSIASPFQSHTSSSRTTRALVYAARRVVVCLCHGAVVGLVLGPLEGDRLALSKTGSDLSC